MELKRWKEEQPASGAEGRDFSWMWEPAGMHSSVSTKAVGWCIYKNESGRYLQSERRRQNQRQEELVAMCLLVLGGEAAGNGVERKGKRSKTSLDAGRKEESDWILKL